MWEWETKNNSAVVVAIIVGGGTENQGEKQQLNFKKAIFFPTFFQVKKLTENEGYNLNEKQLIFSLVPNHP